MPKILSEQSINVNRDKIWQFADLGVNTSMALYFIQEGFNLTVQQLEDNTYRATIEIPVTTPLFKAVLAGDQASFLASRCIGTDIAELEDGSVVIFVGLDT